MFIIVFVIIKTWSLLALDIGHSVTQV